MEELLILGLFSTTSSIQAHKIEDIKVEGTTMEGTTAENIKIEGY